MKLDSDFFFIKQNHFKYNYLTEIFAYLCEPAAEGMSFIFQVVAKSFASYACNFFIL